MYKKWVIFLSSVLSFLGCKSYQEAKPTDIRYSDYIQGQQKWMSPKGSMSYIDKGEGIPILLLHGIPTSGWLYRKMIDPLVANGFRVIVPDMLGFGTSDSPKGYDIYDKKEHAKRILGLMEHLQIPNWHHVMHDAGGVWTWELQQLAPSKINKLTILNTIIYKEGFKPPVKINEKRITLAKLIKWSYTNKTNIMLYQLFKGGTDNFEISEADIKGYKAPLRKGKTDGLNKFFMTNTESIPDYSSALKTLNVPTQVIWGTHDEILNWENQSNRVTADLNIKEEDIHLLAKNHFLQEEATADLIKLISAFKTRK